MLDFLTQIYIPYAAVPAAGALVLLVVNIFVESTVIRSSVDTIENLPQFLGPVTWANLGSAAAVVVATAPFALVDLYFVGADPFEVTSVPPTLASFVLLPWGAWLTGFLVAVRFETWMILKSFLAEDHDHRDLRRGVFRAHLASFGLLALPLLLSTTLFLQAG